VPGAGLLGISGVERGNDAPLVGGPPGVELHTVVDELPSGGTADMVPVALPTTGVGIVPNGVTGVMAVDDIVMVDGAGIDVASVPGTVDGTGTGTGVIEGSGRGGTAGGGGTGTFEPGKTVMAEVAGS
jgi:hypothetical protein